MTNYDDYRRAYCWQCHETREITDLLGVRVRSRQAKKRSVGEWSIAVALDCTHERHGAGDRIPISEVNLRLLEAWLVEGALKVGT